MKGRPAVVGRFPLEAKRLLRQARLNILVRRSLQGACLGLGAGLLLAAASGSIELPLQPWILSVSAASIGFIAGLVIGFARRIDARLLLIQADRVLGSRELASTALELRTGPTESIFSRAIEEDAGRLLAEAGPRAILGPAPLRLAPVAAVLCAGIAAFLLFPVDWRTLFPPRQQASQELAWLGEDLEGFAKRLESRARERNLERSLELSQSLAQLGEDLQNQQIERDEAMERISDLQRQLQEEYSTQLKRMEDPAPDGRPGGPGGPGGSGDQSPSPGSGDGNPAEAGSEQGDGQSQEMSDLADALDFLADKTQQALSQAGTGQDSGSDGQTQDTTGRFDRNLAQGDSAQDGAPGAEGEGDPMDAGPSSSAGITPEKDAKGVASRLTESFSGEPLRAESRSAEGEMRRLLVRALPDWTGSRIPDEQALSSYQKQAESVLSREEIPVELRELVKGYFTIIGMNENDRRE